MFEALAVLEGAPLPAKTGTFDDTVVLDNKLVDTRIRDLYLLVLREARAADHTYLFGALDYRLYYKYVVASGIRLGIPFTVTPHMFRHGAASEDFFRQLRDLTEIQQCGRWRSPASVQRYQKAGRLLTVLRRCGDALVSRARDVDAEHLRFLF